MLGEHDASIIKIRQNTAKVKIVRGDGAWFVIKTATDGMQGNVTKVTEFGHVYEYMGKKVIKENLKRHSATVMSFGIGG